MKANHEDALLADNGSSDVRRVLLRNATLVDFDSGRPVTTVGDLLIVGDTIEAVGRDLASASESAIVVDLEGSVLMPGMVDAHVHAWESQFRGISPDADFNNYLALAHGRLAPLYQPEDLAAGQALAALHALNGGITTIIDNSHNTRTPDHAAAAVEALNGAGIRAVYGAGAPLMGEHQCDLPGGLLDLRERYFSSSNQLLTLRLFDIIPGVESWTFARDNDFDISAEMGMWVTNLDELIDSGLMSPRHTYNHCIGLSDRAWSALADAGVNLNVVPRSEPQFGLGEAKPAIVEAVGHGILPGISSDNEIAYGLDLFSEMRVLLAQQRQLAFSVAFLQQGEVEPLGVGDVLAMAVCGGARNAGLQDKIGSLQPGMQADLVVITDEALHMRPSGNAIGSVVNFASVSDVGAVWVAGRLRKWQGRIVGMDVDGVISRAEASRDRLLEAAGLAEIVNRGLGQALFDVSDEVSNEDVQVLLDESGH